MNDQQEGWARAIRVRDDYGPYADQYLAGLLQACFDRGDAAGLAEALDLAVRITALGEAPR